MPKATVGGIIFRENGGKTEVLLTKRNIKPFKDYWCIPGGHIEQYEDTIEAVIREVKEETNLDFQPLYLCYLDEIFPEIDLHNIVQIFYGEATNVPRAEPGEVSDIGWFDIEEALKMNLAFRHGEALRIFEKLVLREI
ncbi:MAG: NUDIX hydrolase [Bacteroidales bacterium]